MARVRGDFIVGEGERLIIENGIVEIRDGPMETPGAHEPAREAVGEPEGPGRPPGISPERLERIEKLGKLKEAQRLTIEQLAERFDISFSTAKKDWQDYKRLFRGEKM